MRVEVTAAADRELRSALRYLREHSPQAARRTRSRIRAAILSLRRFPQRVRQGSLPGMRELVVRGTPYVVVYLVVADTVFVARIRHTSQDPAP